MNPASAVTLAAAVRAGERTARDAVDESLAAIDERNGELNAFLTLTGDQARAAADAVDRKVAAGENPGPLAGVPIALKDNLVTRGVPTGCASRILAGWVPPYDATVVRQLAEAGAVTVGKTNMDEFAMGSSTENSAFGPTRNPLDTERVPGGSSGGSAAAVAAGMVPLALGSDTGGSIRQPASLCGVVGVKSTYGTVSRLGLVAYGSSLDQIGPLATNVADAALLLEVIGGHDPGDSTSLDRPAPEVSSHLDDGVDGLRVGVVSELMGEGIAPDVAARIRAAAEALAAAGATVEEVSIPAISACLSAYYVVAPAEASSNLARFDGVRYGNRVEAANVTDMMVATRTQGFGDEVKRRIMLGTYALSAGYYDAFYATAQKVRTVLRAEFDAVYANHDVLLCPASPTTAWRLGEKTDDPLTMYLSDVCTIPSNLAGHPAASVPFGADAAGLPIGVQILGPALGEVNLFRAAATLEAAAPDRSTIADDEEATR
ncbi:MAG: Asp-tRNA(Asn)/Glu-tRNA(Gln) amidotransferase subunit GatA [Microthrixaceae bacterium]